MKNLRITMHVEGRGELTVIGRGDNRQTPDEILESVKGKATRLYRSSGGLPEVELKDHQFLLNSEVDEREVDFTFDVHTRTEEHYCNQNYTSKSRDSSTPANGPVGYTENEAA